MRVRHPNIGRRITQTPRAHSYEKVTTAQFEMWPLAIYYGIVIVATIFLCHGVIVGYYNDKPILMQNILDFVNVDFWLLFSILMVNGTLISIFKILYPDPLPDYLSYPWSHSHQFMVQITFIYLSANITIRYLHVYNKRMIFDDISEATVRKIVRAIGFCSSLLLNIILAIFGGEPKLYAHLANTCETCKNSFHTVPIVFLCFLAFVLNIVFRMLIFMEKRQGTLAVRNLQNNNGRANFTLPALLLMTILFIGVVGVRLMENEGSRFIVISAGYIIPGIYILAKEDITNYAKKLKPSMRTSVVVPIT